MKMTDKEHEALARMLEIAQAVSNVQKDMLLRIQIRDDIKRLAAWGVENTKPKKNGEVL